MASDSMLVPSFRWLLLPIAGVAVIAAIVRSARRRARQPAVRPMSDQWLREHGAARTE